MRHFNFTTVLMSVLVAACCPTRIVTVSPNTYNPGMYSTIVTTPRSNTMTTTTRVIAANEDISLSLDLQAVAAAFAQSATVEEFENLLNNGSYMLSNLDLNNDGYVDYLRVLETVEDRTHVFVIQAVLAPDIYQDVATVVAEVPVTGNCYVQVIGSEFLYGPRFIIEPVMIATPPIFVHLRLAVYTPWRSPWYWGHFPPCYRHPAPLYLSHYQAYVDTYMRNHRYCHEFRYAQTCHCPQYEQMARPYRRNDYGAQHPERSFTTRTADIPVRSSIQASGRAVNARDIREEQNAIAVTNVTPSRNATREASGSTSRSASTASGTTSRTVTRSTGSTATTGTASTASSASGFSTSTSRSAASGNTGRATARTGNASSSGASSRSGATGQTTVRSSVSNSGTANTRISTSSSNARTSSTKSTSGSTSRNASTSGSSRSTATSQSSGNTRSSATGSSTRTSGNSATRSTGSGSTSRSSAASSTSRSSGNNSGSATRSSGSSSSSSSRGVRR